MIRPHVKHRLAEQIVDPVVKALNMLLSSSLSDLGRPRGAPDRLAVATAGDDSDANAIASKLADEICFDPIDGGSVAKSWRQQPSTLAYCCDWNAEEARAALAAARPW